MIRPPDELVAFLPEQPYLPPSNLRQLLLASKSAAARKPADEEVNRLLKEIRLDPIITRHDGFEKDCDWENILSFEERQLMAVAKVILATPSFVLMDRLETALQPETQKRVLNVLAQRGISTVLFGRGAANASLHDSFLELREDGSWEWKDFRDNANQQTKS